MTGGRRKALWAEEGAGLRGAFAGGEGGSGEADLDERGFGAFGGDGDVDGAWWGGEGESTARVQEKNKGVGELSVIIKKWQEGRGACGATEGAKKRRQGPGARPFVPEHGWGGHLAEEVKWKLKGGEV